MIKTFWTHLIIFGFRLLYNEAAGLYDAVSWAASLGRWRRWQQSARPYLPPGGRILEVGFGPGHLLADLTRAGYEVVGLDLSPSMLRLARRRLRRQGLPAGLCRGQAQALPFAPHAFAAVILTFPTGFAYELAWVEELARVLRPRGRAIVVEMASFDRRSPAFRFLEWLYRITGQRGPVPDLPGLLAAAGFVARREKAVVDGTTVGLVVAEWPAGEPTASFPRKE